MKKRLKKKEYKSVLEAKAMLDNWDGDMFKAINVGYIDPNTRNTRLGKAIRRTVSLMGVDRQWRGWSIALPATKDVMQLIYTTPSYKITLFGPCYIPGSDPIIDTKITIDLRKLCMGTDKIYEESLKKNPRYEMVQDFLSCIVDAMQR